MFLLWVGAAVSISEIFTGGLLAPLGLRRGVLAILVGHLIGVGLLSFGGYLSFSRGKNAMETVGFSLGRNGGRLIAFLNVIQLIGWTIVMIVQAGSAFTSVFGGVPFRLAAFVLSALVLLWALFFGGSLIGRLNDVVVVLLSLLCILLFSELRGGALPSPALPGPGMSMALAVELSIAMPVSWLPLVGDYSSAAEDKTCAAAMPFAGYFTGSVLMYIFGLYIAVATGGDIFAFIAESRFRLVACGVVVLSTVTTAFLDLYSAAVSSRQIVKTKSGRTPILVIGILAALAAVLFPVERYGDFLTGFLTAIGMVFVPVYTVLFLDFLTKKTACTRPFNLAGCAAAAVGMLAYYLLGSHEVWIPTLLTILLVSVLYLCPTFLKNKGRLS